MRSLGVFVPEQDASWEKDNAYGDLYTQYSRCDAEKCVCKKGREYVGSKGDFLLARCRLCGASATHRLCSNLKTVANWACEPCLSVEKKAGGDKKKPPKEKPKVVASEPKASTSSAVADEVDVDHVSARSGNRRVRNGNRRAKCQPPPVTPVRVTPARVTPARVTPVIVTPFPVTPMELERDEEFDLSKVKISQSCFSYFPYTEAILRDYREKATLPDWRTLSIAVNVTRWIPETVSRSNPSQICLQGPSRATSVCEITNIKPVKRSKSRKMAKNKSVEASFSKLSGNSNLIPTTLTRERKRNRRVTRWRRGVLCRRKRARKRPTPGDSRQENVQAPVISETGVETKSESAGTLQQLSDEMKEVEVEIIPATAQEKAESLFFSAMEIEGENEKLPLQHIPLVRRRKQVFPSQSDPNRKYFEVNGNILEVNYSTSSSDDKDTREMKRKRRCKTTKNVSGTDDNVNIPTSSPPLLIAGQVLKMNVEYDVEISYDGLQIRIDESENSPTKKLCGSKSSNWKPISKYVNNTATSKSDYPTAQNILLTPVPEQKGHPVLVGRQPSPIHKRPVTLKATTPVKPSVEVGATAIPSTLLAAFSEDEDCIIVESGPAQINKEHSVPLNSTCSFQC